MNTSRSWSLCQWHLVRASVAVTLALAAGSLGTVLTRAGGDTSVPYPDGYRTWVHVKTVLVSSEHPDFAQSGGFRHIYANPQAVTGYRTGVFPEGSTIVVDWLEGRDEKGMFTESTRRRLDVMVKDRSRFAATGGWGFERFKGDSRSERMVTAADTQCAACHSAPGTRDHVYSKLRE